MAFYIPTKTGYAECDCNNRLKLSAALRYMQQASSAHLETVDLAPAKLFRENMVFLLSKMCVKINRMPVAGDELLIGTAATETRGARFVREFVIDSPHGERLVSALSLWILADPCTKKILRPASFPYPMPFAPTLLTDGVEDIRLPKIPEAAPQATMQIPVRYSHIDVNHHINNSMYADFLCDALPYDLLCKNGLDTAVISFQNEAKHGDLLTVTTNSLSPQEFLIVGRQASGACFEALAILK